MVRRKDIEAEVNGFLNALEQIGYPYQKAVLFGSMVSGKSHDYSDIDLAVWSSKFEGNYYDLIEALAPLKRKFKNIEIHPFHPDDNSDNNFFIGEIERTGIKISKGIPFEFEEIDIFRSRK